MITFNGFDIFGVPIEYATKKARQLRWPAYIWHLSEILHIEISGTFKNSVYNIYRCVFEGFLSFQSASYFCLGKFDSSQDNYLRSFVDFLDSNSSLSSSKITLLWQGSKNRVPVNMFVFPLEAPGSNSVFSSFQLEREQYLKNAALSQKELHQRQLLLDLDDLPPDDYEL